MAEPDGRKPGHQLGGPLLDPVHQRGADAQPAVLGVNDPPALDDAGLIAQGLPIRDDRPHAVDHDPGVGAQIEGHPAPLVSQEVRIQDGLPGVGDEHVGHRIGVVRCRRSEGVPGGEIHAGSVPRRSGHP